MATIEERNLAIEALEKMSNDAFYATSPSEQATMIAVLEEQGQYALKILLNEAPLIIPALASGC